MRVCACVCVCVCVHVLSSLCHTISTDIPDPLSPPSLSSVALGRLSGLYTVSTQSCCMQVRAGHPAFARRCEGVHKSTSLMSWFLLLQQFPACLVRLIQDCFRDGWLVAIQLQLCGVLPPGLVQYCSKHSCVLAVQLFHPTFSQRLSSASIQHYRHDRCLEKNCVLFNRSDLTSI